MGGGWLQERNEASRRACGLIATGRGCLLLSTPVMGYGPWLKGRAGAGGGSVPVPMTEVRRFSNAGAHAGDEFEREPVPEHARKGPSAFWGVYAGEHTAGTEFMIGPLFVVWGASAFDLIFGVLLGNFPAVLTWRFLPAEIATQRRLTRYYPLERITGRKLATLYNFLNGVLFCFLVGVMVTVSAMAVGVPFGDRIRMPSFGDAWSMGWCGCWCVCVCGWGQP